MSETGFLCTCGARMKVTDSRSATYNDTPTVRRRRRCEGCGRRVSTVELDLPALEGRTFTSRQLAEIVDLLGLAVIKCRRLEAPEPRS